MGGYWLLTWITFQPSDSSRSCCTVRQAGGFFLYLVQASLLQARGRNTPSITAAALHGGSSRHNLKRSSSSLLQRSHINHADTLTCCCAVPGPCCRRSSVASVTSPGSPSALGTGIEHNQVRDRLGATVTIATNLTVWRHPAQGPGQPGRHCPVPIQGVLAQCYQFKGGVRF